MTGKTPDFLCPDKSVLVRGTSLLPPVVLLQGDRQTDIHTVLTTHTLGTIHSLIGWIQVGSPVLPPK